MHLNAHSAPIFGYASNFAHVQLGRPSAGVLLDLTRLLAASISQFVVLVLMRFLIATPEGVTAHQCLDLLHHVDDIEIDSFLMLCVVLLVSSSPRHTRVLVPVPTPKVDAILAFGSYYDVYRSVFDASYSLLGLNRSHDMK